jgi:hypothetical protein
MPATLLGDNAIVRKARPDPIDRGLFSGTISDCDWTPVRLGLDREVLSEVVERDRSCGPRCTGEDVDPVHLIRPSGYPQSGVEVAHFVNKFTTYSAAGIHVRSIANVQTRSASEASQHAVL